MTTKTYISPAAMIVMSVINAAEMAVEQQDKNILKQFGLSDQLIVTLSSLSQLEKSKLVSKAKSFFHIEFDESSLGLLTHSIREISKSEKLLITAIKLGASRKMMTDMAHITAQRFTEIRSQFNIDEHRARPIALTDEDDKLINQFMIDMDTNQYESQLDLLIDIAQTTQIDINRIYMYYGQSLPQINRKGDH